VRPARAAAAAGAHERRAYESRTAFASSLILQAF